MNRKFLILLLFLGLAGCTQEPTHKPYRITSQYAIDSPQFERTIGSLLGPPLIRGNSVQTLVNGDQIFPAMLLAIAQAKSTITFETFIYWQGRVGNTFTQALCERARAGVKTHVMIDPVGSDRIDKKYIQRMKEAGVQVDLYNPLRWFDLQSLAKLNNRTHRKLLIIDGIVGFTGGVGVADEWGGNADAPNHWRDTHYRVEGPVVAQLQAAFVDHWMESNGGVLHGDAYFPPLSETGSLTGQVFKSSSEGGSESMELMYLLSIAASRKTIRISTPYFIPDDTTIWHLMEAKRRGVRIQIIVPNEKIDLPFVRRASHDRWGKLLSQGVEFYEYQPTMYHTKLMIVDDLWTSIGSANLDNRSFKLNSEANLNILDRAFAQAQARIFDQDLTRSKKVTYQQWNDRPWYKKLAESIADWLGPEL
jgi:cardiolipin synthase